MFLFVFQQTILSLQQLNMFLYFLIKLYKMKIINWTAILNVDGGLLLLLFASEASQLSVDRSAVYM